MAKAKKTGNAKKKPIEQYDHKGKNQLTSSVLGPRHDLWLSRCTLTGHDRESGTLRYVSKYGRLFALVLLNGQANG